MPEGFYEKIITSKGKKYRYIYFKKEVDGVSIHQTVCRADINKNKIFQKISQFQEKPRSTVGWLIDQYMSSPQFIEKSSSTQRAYELYAVNWKNYPMRSGRVFGDLYINKVTPILIRQYLDKKEAKYSANRHVQFLKSVYNWGRERYAQVQSNPCEKVRLHTERPRDRYVTDEEFFLVRKFAPAAVKIFMDIAHVCRARFNEISRLKIQDVQEEYLILNRSKGSRGEKTQWTPFLKKAIDRAFDLNRDAGGEYLIHDKHGNRIGYSGFSSAWKRTMAQALKSGLKERFKFHDLKAKGVSDHPEHESGHRSEKMKEVYIRKLKRVDGTPEPKEEK